MKTKEQILEEHFGHSYGFYFGQLPLLVNVLAAMDEYAKEVQEEQIKICASVFDDPELEFESNSDKYYQIFDKDEVLNCERVIE